MISWIKKTIFRMGEGPKTVAVIRLSGVIAAASRRSQTLNIESLFEPLEKAFKPKGHAAVFVIVNSPGGSPVQSSLIGKRIRQLALEYDKPVFAVVEDVAASGGYWIACAADEIWADPASIVGSIGVVSAGFGFNEVIERYGIDRRVYTAGANKVRLDAFQAEKADDKEWLLGLQLKMHRIFKDHVLSARGSRLKGSEDELMTGEIWLAGEAKEQGLIDGLGDVMSVAREKFGDKVKLKKVKTSGGGVLSMITGSLQPNIPKQAIESLETESLWARTGL